MYGDQTVVGSRVRSHERRNGNDDDEERTFGLYVDGIAVGTAAILGLHGRYRRGRFRGRVWDAGAGGRRPNSGRAQEDGQDGVVGSVAVVGPGDECNAVGGRRPERGDRRTAGVGAVSPATEGSRSLWASSLQLHAAALALAPPPPNPRTRRRATYVRTSPDGAGQLSAVGRKIITIRGPLAKISS